MASLLELWDEPVAPGGFPHLDYVLAGLPEAAHALDWLILDLDPIGFEVPRIDLRPYFDPPVRSGLGIRASWADLERLAHHTVQIPDGLIVAPRIGVVAPVPTDDDETILSRCEAVLAPFDSTFWNLWVPDTWVAHLSASFRDLRPAEPGKFPLTTYGAPRTNRHGPTTVGNGHLRLNGSRRRDLSCPPRVSLVSRNDRAPTFEQPPST